VLGELLGESLTLTWASRWRNGAAAAAAPVAARKARRESDVLSWPEESSDFIGAI